MATNSIDAELLKAALYKALYPREAGQYPWNTMKGFADVAADDVETYSRIVVARVNDVASEVLKDIDTGYRSREAGH